MVLVVSKQNPSTVSKIESGNFANFNVWERTHIQEWIRQHPEILGEELLILSIEFNRFKNSNDRLDILALDRKGNLVVIELKRDEFAGYADLQALRYAAMVSSMTVEMMMPYFISYQRNNSDLKEKDINSDTAYEQIKEFVTEVESFEEFSNKPRIILCSEDFSTELTTTVLWLNQTGLDISCVRIKPHKIDDRIVIVPSKIIPLQEAKQYLIEVQQKEEVKQYASNKSKRPTTMKILIEAGKLQKGDKIYLKQYLPDYLKFEANNLIYEAEVTGKLGQKDNLVWLFDGKEYSISNLTSKIFQTYHPLNENPGAITGGAYWHTVDGKNLFELASQVWAESQAQETLKN